MTEEQNPEDEVEEVAEDETEDETERHVAGIAGPMPFAWISLTGQRLLAPILAD